MKWTLLPLLFVSILFAEELPFSAWQSSGPNDRIEAGHLFLLRKTQEERRPEVFQMVEGLKKGERYELLFQYRTRNTGNTLQLHLNFRDGLQHVFKPDAVSTVWRPFRYSFIAGEGAMRVTFLIPGGALADAEIRQIIVREEGELFSPAAKVTGSLPQGLEYWSYDLNPDCEYKLSLACNQPLAWSIELYDYDGKNVGTISDIAATVAKSFCFPQEAAFLKLRLKASPAAVLRQVSLRKIHRQ